MMNNKIFSCIFFLSMFPHSALASGDTLKESCYQSMRYNVYVQLSGNAYLKKDAEYFESEALNAGNWQGISSNETKRMIAMASNNPSSAEFASRYLSDKSFATAYASGYINDCLKNPDKYISR